MKSGEVLPDVYNLRKISAAFQVSSDYIIGLTEELDSSFLAPEVTLLFNRYKEMMKNLIIEKEKYYWIKVEVNEDRSYTRSVQTEWAGFDENGEEIRRAREVIPEKVIAICQKLDEPVVVINKISEISLLYLFGGNAIITAKLYEEHINV